MTESEVMKLLKKELASKDPDELALKVGYLATMKGKCPEDARRKLLDSFTLRLVNACLQEGILP